LVEYGQYVGAERCGAGVDQPHGRVQRLRLAVEERAFVCQSAGGGRVVSLVEREPACRWLDADQRDTGRGRLAPRVGGFDGQRHRAGFNMQQSEKVAGRVQHVDGMAVDRHRLDRHLGRARCGAAGQHCVRPGPQPTVRRRLGDDHRGRRRDPADRRRLGPAADRRGDRIPAGLRTGQREHGAAQAVGECKPAARVRADNGKIHTHAGQRLPIVVGQRGHEQLLVADREAGRPGRQIKVRDGVDPPKRLAAQIAVGIGVGETVDRSGEGKG